MRLTFRAKLNFIVGAAALAFVVLIVTSSIIASRVNQQLTAIQQRYVPKVELEPQLEGQFDRLRRALQDAVAANDGDALDQTREIKNGLLDLLAAAHDVVDPIEAALLRKAVEDYYADAFDLSRRMISGETGEELVNAMASMQAKQTRAKELVKKATAIDRGELAAVFAAAAQAQTTAARLRLAIGVTCLVVVAVLSLWLSRSVLAALGELTAGFARFGKGTFTVPIKVTSRDELGDVAEHANSMAESLRRLAAERERADWFKAGHAGLTRELRGELEPDDVANRAVRFLARHVDAPAGALYYVDPPSPAGDFPGSSEPLQGRRERALQLLGQYALSPTEGDANAAPSFRPGEGLVGQAAQQEELTVIHDPPADYLRVRSGLGDGPPRVIVLLPLVHASKVKGVLELALFKPWSELFGELLLSVRETTTIAIEVALARASTRELLAQTQQQAARLRAQEEKLQATNEELQAQQEELRQTNDELTEQAAQLEEQRRSLQEKNVELDDARRGLERKADELTKVSAYKSQFLANMSHELRTPLNSMLLLSNLLAENEAGNLTARQVEFCKTIYSAGNDLLGLINQVLDLAKVEAGKQRLLIERVPLESLANHVERVFKPLASDKGLDFVVEVSPEVPETIATDSQRLQQILTNLLANAIKFTERGKVTFRLESPEPDVRFRRDDLRADRAVAFAVSDTGVGIAPEHRERIFFPFEQVDTASDRRYGGTGLGLAISRELAQLLGGELQLESSIGKGSTFVCYLPFESKAAATSSPALVAPGEPSAVRGAAPIDTGTARAGDPYLLIIEDDAVFAKTMGDVARAQGLQYVWAANGRTGMRQAKERMPSGIILDVKLPDVDGFKIMEELRADPDTAHVPVHFISAMDASERGLAMGAVGYLTKPATRRDLVRVVESLAAKPIARSGRILVVEDDKPLGDSVVKQLAAENLEARHVVSATEALEAVKKERFACVILDLSLPDMDGLELLHSLEKLCGSEMPAVVVYTARALSKNETQRLEAYAEAIVLKEGPSAERLVDEVRLFVRRLKEGLAPRRSGASSSRPTGMRLEGRRVLVADDDMRTVYALSATLRAKGAEVFVADTGQAALGVLDEHPDIEAVLMDIMMPEMDGYEAIRRIRQDARFHRLPVIALTAKAMKDDKDKCISVGASDYLPKPIDPDHLLSMLHSRLAENGHGS